MKNIQLLIAIVFTLFSMASLADSHVSSSPDNAALYFIAPLDGESVSSPVKVQFGLSGMGVSPAGFEKKNTGHHHLLIDKDQLPVAGQSMGKEVKHFGGGQTETLLDLPKGEHTLQLILGNHLHVPHDPFVVSEKITITVK